MQENFFVDGSNHFVNNLFRETEKSQQQQRDYSNVIIREEQPWQRKKQKKLLRKLLKKLQKKLLKKLKRSSCFCKAIAFERADRICWPFFFISIEYIFDLNSHLLSRFQVLNRDFQKSI